MVATRSRPYRRSSVKLNTRVASRPYLVVDVPPDQAGMVQNALDKLAEDSVGVSAQTILLDALRTATEQAYFWTPEWQARERAAEQAVEEGRVRTFDTMDDMLDFLNAQ
jgi:hypothetical protein